MLLLFNPRSANHKHRIPNSILQVGASVFGKIDITFVDGNMETHPWEKILSYLQTGKYKYFGSTVMPGPQLKQAIPFTRDIKKLFPEIKTFWGGYFASNQYKSSIESGWVDFILDGPADISFPSLIEKLEKGETDFEKIAGLIYLKEGEIIRTAKPALPDMDSLPPLPYEHLNSFYPLERMLPKTFLGKRTLAYHSSFGCPFTCSFCAVVPIYNARWKGVSAQRIYSDVKKVKELYGADSVEFHDNNFFVAEKRTVEFAKLIHPEKMVWWGEGRIDTIDKYKDESLHIMREAGCKMIFFGAESSDDDMLKQIDKGGTQTAEQILSFAERMKKVDIIPEYSFVLGFPDKSPEKVMERIDKDIAFIKQLKRLNPDTEIIIYLYSPVPTEGSELYEAVKSTGFRFPEKLEDWLEPIWEKFDLRKNPLTPWLTPEMVDKIMNFETVLNGYHPTASDFRLSPLQRKIMRGVSSFRYKNNFYKYPYEIKALMKLWKYRQPEIEGF